MIIVLLWSNKWGGKCHIVGFDFNLRNEVYACKVVKDSNGGGAATIMNKSETWGFNEVFYSSSFSWPPW